MSFRRVPQALASAADRWRVWDGEAEQLRVGEDIQNRCTKCGVVAHVIVAMVDRKIVKVECKECGSRHRHRPLVAKTTRASDSRKARTVKLTKPSVEPDLSRPVRPYLARETYAVGDRIDHRTLGRGVIERVTGSGKVQVSFSDGIKTLIHGRGG